MPNLFQQQQVKIKQLFIKPKESIASITWKESFTLSNRAIRLVKDSSRFLHVTFDATHKTWDDEEWREQVKKIYDEGIELEVEGQTQRYKFLAFSVSGLREGQSWFFQEDSKWTVYSLIEALGNFETCFRQGAAKFSSRLGLSFGSNIRVGSVPRGEVRYIPDILTTDNKYCFTDGVGRMSPRIRDQISVSLGLSDPPSVFQFRYRGFKGIVAVDPSAKFSLELRPYSMQKYKCNLTDFEVLNWSKSTPYASLNKQILTLLASLKVPTQAVLEILTKYLDRITRINTDRTIAMEELGGLNIKPALNCLKAGHQLQDPFLQGILRKLQLKYLSKLQLKMSLPLQKSRWLFGVIDEYRILKPNEIYLKLDLEAIKGPCFITKNPCLHPGDIRVVNAVGECSSLSHLKNCIVFPSVGERPLTDQISGGDLDGDLYFVCWESSLIPHPKNIPPPAHYPKTKGISAYNKPCSTLPEAHELSKSFFLDFLNNNNLGAITVAHELVSDRSPHMAFDEKALLLAKIASDAVDSVKSGCFVQLPDDFQQIFAELQPHWKESDKSCYHSTSLLGHMYDCVVQTRKNLLDQKQATSIDQAFKYFVFDPQVFEAQKIEAVELMKRYNEELRNVLSSKENGDIRNKLLNQLTQTYRKKFFQGMRSSAEIKQKAAAWFFTFDHLQIV